MKFLKTTLLSLPLVLPFYSQCRSITELAEEYIKILTQYGETGTFPEGADNLFAFDYTATVMDSDGMDRYKTWEVVKKKWEWIRTQYGRFYSAEVRIAEMGKHHVLITRWHYNEYSSRPAVKCITVLYSSDGERINNSATYTKWLN